jgi:transcriptional regulator with XRE-family HTH domain
LAKRAGVSRDTISNAERGLHSLQASTLHKVARALGKAPSELLAEEERLVPKARSSSLEPSLLDGLEGEQTTTEALSPKQRRYAAWARRAELERTFQHLTLRLETLQDEAKTAHESGATPKDLWPVFMDSLLLTRGAEALLAENREEAEELGGETAEERQLRDRLEHRIEDADEVRGTIGDMWRELLDAKNEAENEALRKELSPKTEPANANNVRNLFRREQAV